MTSTLGFNKKEQFKLTLKICWDFNQRSTLEIRFCWITVRQLLVRCYYISTRKLKSKFRQTLLVWAFLRKVWNIKTRQQTFTSYFFTYSLKYFFHQEMRLSNVTYTQSTTNLSIHPSQLNSFRTEKAGPMTIFCFW